MHLGLNLLAALALILGVYRSFRDDGKAAFTLAMLNLVTFCLATLLARVSIDLGVSLGLFAIFGILRYRTSALDIGDLTYVFVVIGLAVINGIAVGDATLFELALLNGLIVLAALVLELLRSRSVRPTMPLRYDRLDLLPPGRRAELLADLSERLGVRCVGVRVESVNLLMSTAELSVELEEGL